MADEGAERLITFDIPQKEGKEGYVGTLFGLILKLGTILTDTNLKHTDIRIEYLMQLFISLIPEYKVRDEIRRSLKEDIDIYYKNNGTATNEQKAREVNMIHLNHLGYIMEYIDLHIGIAINNKIGFSARKRKKKDGDEQ